MRNILLLFVIFCSSIINAADHNKRALEPELESNKRARPDQLNSLAAQLANNYPDFIGLQEAIEAGDINEYARRLTLFKTTKDFNTFLKLSILVASQHGQLAILKYLVDGERADLSATVLGMDSALFYAISAGQVATTLFIANQLGIDALDARKGVTAAIMAAGLGQLEVLKALKAGGADLSHPNISGTTPLCSAISNKMGDTAGYIVEQLGLNTLDRGKDMTAVTMAAVLGDEKLLKSLLGEGADLSVTGKDGEPALCHAIRYHRDKIAFLMAKKAGINSRYAKEKMTAAMMAAVLGRDELLESLIENGASLNFVDGSGYSALEHAIIRGRIRSTLLIAQKLGINSFQSVSGITAAMSVSRMTAAMIAASLGKEKVLNSLIANGANLKIFGDSRLTALAYAVKHGHINTTLSIIGRLGINAIDEASGMTAAMMALAFGQIDLFKVLVKMGTDLSIKSQNGHSILHIAIRRNNLEMVAYLTQAQGKILTKMDVAPGISPVNFAAELGHTEIMNELISQGCDLAARNNDVEQNNCLTAATRSRNPATVESLLEKGVDVNLMDGFARTPLMIATIIADYDIFKLLLQHGASLTARDLRGKTVAFYATDPEFKKFLTGVKKNQDVKKELLPVRTYYQDLMPTLGHEIADVVIDYLPGMMAMIEFRELVKNEMLLKELLAAQKKNTQK